MGKYTKLRHKFEPFIKSIEDGSPLFGWYSKVNEWKKEFLGTESGENANALRLAAEFAIREDKKEQLEKSISQLNIELEALSGLGVDAMETEGMEKVNLSNGGYVRIDDLPFPSIKDKAAAIEWLLENDMPELIEISSSGLNKKQLDALLEWGKRHGVTISVSVNTNTLQAFVRERVVNGISIPEWVKVFMKTKLAVKAPQGSVSGGVNHD